MFDRGRSETTNGAVLVALTRGDGREIKGRVRVPQGRSLVDMLNAAGGFIEFESLAGEGSLIAKGALRDVRPIDLPSAPRLSAGSDVIDPFAILGVAVDASDDELRHTYVDLAKAYHPDRYETVDLPREVRDYLSAMARRINVAYEMATSARAARALRQEPCSRPGGGADRQRLAAAIRSLLAQHASCWPCPACPQHQSGMCRTGTGGRRRYVRAGKKRHGTRADGAARRGPACGWNNGSRQARRATGQGHGRGAERARWVH
jgi:hypothetical protein